MLHYGTCHKNADIPVHLCRQENDAMQTRQEGQEVERYNDTTVAKGERERKKESFYRKLKHF
jgi:hypothetical protein